MKPSANPRPNIFDHTSYKSYLLSWIANRGRGARTAIAQSARCHLAYVSQVLNGNSHLSLEQAEMLNPLLEHSDDECHFFILLVESGRAGTTALRARFEKRVQEILQLRQQLKSRFRIQSNMTNEHQATYYGHWSYCAIHMAIRNQTLRSPKEIANQLGISQAKTLEVLNFLCSVGLATQDNGRYLPSASSIHLEHNSPMINKHHTNWRLQALRSLDQEQESELHYSSVISLSQSDVPIIREALVRAIEEVRGKVKQSGDETVFCYTIDLFNVSQK